MIQYDIFVFITETVEVHPRTNSRFVTRAAELKFNMYSNILSMFDFK